MNDKQEKFEGIFILNIKTNEKEIKNIIEELTNKMEKCSKIEKVGIKTLAYEIKENKKGYYIVINFKANQQQRFEIEKYSRLNDNIIKFIIIKLSK